MSAIRRRLAAVGKDERGFTLYELLITIAIMGILIAIAIIIFLGLLERWRVEAAANQLKADMRLAHASASNQLTDWRIVLAPEKEDEDAGPDYYLVKLARPYGPDIAGNLPPVVDPNTPPKPRFFPANVVVTVRKNKNGAPIQDDAGGGYYLSPSPSVSGTTRTLEFNSDGAMTGYGGSPSGTVAVTIDGDPQGQVRYLAATSRIKILP